MPEAAKPEVPPTPAVAEAVPQPLVAVPLEPEATPPAEAVAVPPEAAMAPLAAEPENPTPEADVSAEAEAAEEEAMAETSAVPEGETEASAEEAAAVEEAEAEAESTEEAAPEAAPAEGAAEGAAPAEGGAGAAAGDRAPASPEADPAFQAVVKRSKGVAKAQRAHAPASDKAAAAQGAASGPSNEVASMAAGAQVGEMDAQEPQAFDRESFKAALLEKIEKTAPRNLKEADNFKDSGKLDAVKRDMTSTVGEKKAQAQGNIAEATQAPPDTTGIEPKPVIPLEPADAGPPPADLGATAAAPKPKTDSEISLQEGSDSLDQQMQDNEITEAQLENANEPAFQGAVDSKRTAQTDAQERPLAYRQEEQGMVAEAKTTAVGSAEAQLTAMHGTRSSLLEQVATGQVETKSEDELKRVAVANHIEAIYQRTKTNVETRLASLDEEVNQAFDTGSARAQKAFENHVKARMDAYKDDRYSGVRGKYRWVRDKFKGLPKAVNVFYEEGRNLYLAIMDGVLDNIAIIVETGLNDAKTEIALGKQEVQTYVDSLPVDLQDVGQQAADKIQSKFDELEQQVNDKQGELVDALAKKYHDNLQKLDARIEEMKAANRGLIDKALGAIVGVIKTILALKDMLLNVLARAAAVIGTIISDPIGFLGNLVSGVMMGLENFMANIGQHLKKGLMEWLFGALGEAGIEMPDSFDFKGILSLVLQILGLTYANIRARAVNIVGEDVVKRIEQTVEIFKVLMTEGPAGLWDMIQEQVGNLKDMVLDGIESFIKEKVLIAGITWIISLLNPAAAFIKACKAIYDIVMFFVQRGSQILALVNAVLDSVTAIAKGALGAAAAAVENALAKAIPVAIAFLASLLGLGGISEKIRTIIEKVRAPVNRAIDWVINKAVKLVNAVGNLLGFGKQDPKKESVETGDPEHDLKVKAGLAALHEEEKRYIEVGEISRENAEKVATAVKSKHSIFKSIVVVDGIETWDYEYVSSPKGREEGGDKDNDDNGGDSGDPINKLKQRAYKAKITINKLPPDRADRYELIERINKIEGDIVALEALIKEGIEISELKDDISQIDKNLKDLEKEIDTPKDEKAKWKEIVDKAEHIPPADYSRGKHWQGTSEEERRQNSEKGGAGQFLYSMTASDVAVLERETLLTGDLMDKGSGTYHAFKTYGKPIGYANGEEAYTHRAELTSADTPQPFVHSHPR
jgi:hypothetical protein